MTPRVREDARRLAALVILVSAGLILGIPIPRLPPVAEAVASGTTVVAQPFHISNDWASPFTGAVNFAGTDPMIEGSVVAWVTPDRHIRLHNLADGTEQEISDSDAAATAMGIMSFGDDGLQLSSGGRLLVWPDRRSGVDTIYWYNLDTGQSGPVSPEPGTEQNLPVTNGTQVAWEEPGGLTTCLFLRDLGSGMKSELGCGGADAVRIGGIDGPYLGFYAKDPSGDYQSVVEDLRTGARTPVTFAGLQFPTVVVGLGEGLAFIGLPSTAGPSVPSLGGLNLSTGDQFVLGSYLGSQPRDGAQIGRGHPISDQLVVYEKVESTRGGLGSLGIWAFDVSSGLTYPVSNGSGAEATISGDTVVWAAPDGIDGAYLSRQPAVDQSQGDGTPTEAAGD